MNHHYRVLFRTEGEEDKALVYLPTLAAVTAYLHANITDFFRYPCRLVEKVEITIDEDTYGVTLDYLYCKLLVVKAWTVTPTCRLKPCPLVVRERYMTGYPAPEPHSAR